jgi:hypothetical protein
MYLLNELLDYDGKFAPPDVEKDIVSAIMCMMSGLYQKEQTRLNNYKLGLPKWYVKFVNKYFKWML